MRYLLNQIFNKDATLDNLIATLRSDRFVATKQGAYMVEPVNAFLEDPFPICHDLFVMIASAPRELAEQAAALIQADNEGLAPSDTAENVHLSKIAREMGGHLDCYTKFLARWEPWKQVYKNPIPVIRIWRTKEDTVVGEPEERNVQVSAMSNSLSSMVVAETETGHKKILIATSNGRYRENPGGEPVREDFLVDIPKMICDGIEEAVHRKNRNCSPREACEMLNRMVVESVPLLASMSTMAKELSRRGALIDPEHIFERHDQEFPRTGLKAEDSPNALITIGEWA